MIATPASAAVQSRDEARRSAMLRLIFVLGTVAKESGGRSAMRRFRLALWVLGEPIPNWATQQ